MDLQTLSNLFATTLSADPNVRRAAELEIRKITNTEGLITALLQIIAADSVDVTTRQSCAVWIKNRVYNCYDLTGTRKPDQTPISESDKTALRSSILRLIAVSPSRAITFQLAMTLKNMIMADIPGGKWPTLISEIKALLGSSNVREIHAGCVASLEAVRAFRYRTVNDVMVPIVIELFPSLVTVASNMIQTPPSAAQEVPTMLHLILKTYKTSMILDLSEHQRSQESLVPWGHLFFALINLQLPPEAVPADEDERERCEWWKAKKWAYAILNRLFHRYGNPSQLPKTLRKTYTPFATHFVAVFAPQILNTFLHQVELFVRGEAWLSRKATYQIFQFFTECLKPKTTWTLIKPHFETLLENFVFPRLVFLEQKQQLWESDPVEFVRLSVDEYESFATPAAAAATFILNAASNRTKSTFGSILSFVHKILLNPSPAPQRYGALNITSTLVPWIIRHPEVKDTGMEDFLSTHVLPAFTAPEPYMRMVACEVIANVMKVKMKWSKPENFEKSFRAVTVALKDAELPVRVQAALALVEMIQGDESGSVRKAVAPEIGVVVQDLLKLSDETDLESLNNGMEVIVEAFQDELMPVAAQLTARLCDSYMRLARESVGPHERQHNTVQDMEHLFDEEDDKTYAAMGVSKTIWTIISSIESVDILNQLQEIVIPIIIFTLENKMLDLLDSAYDLVDTFTFKTRAISPSMWPVLQLTYNLFKSDAVDFLDEMLPSLDNFVSFGADVINSRPEYKQLLLDIFTTSMTSDHLGENDRANGCKLAESMLLNLRGQIDDALQIFIVTSLDHLDKAETIIFRLTNMEVLINAILYNPSAALHIMESTRPGMGRAFFDKWFQAIHVDQKLPRVHDKKLTILALCALMELHPSAIPETLKAGWSGILAGILRIFTDLPRAIQARKDLEESLGEEEEEEEEVEALNLQDDDEDVWDEESAYLDMLATEGQRLREKSDNAEGDAEEEEDDDDDEFEIEEELGVFTPLDNVNPYIVFKNALNTFQVQNPALYEAATENLDLDQQTLLMDVLRVAEAQANEAAAAPQS